MIQPLVIGKTQFANNLVQGPLAGVSCAPFRRLAWRYSQPAFSCTEMISCNTLLNKPEMAQRRFIEIASDEGPVCFQLSSTDPHELGESVKRVTEYGASLIDLNCGCPVKKIRSKGAGSKLLSQVSSLYALIAAMKSNTDLPISIKIRIDGASQDNYNQDVATMLMDSGVDCLIVHGRHWTDGYDTACYYDQIQFFVDTLNIPVIGNGDVQCVGSLRKMLSTGCAGAMISRAGVGQPWLIRQLLSEINAEAYDCPSHQEIGEIFLEHVEALIQIMRVEKFAIFQARKLAKYYARHLPKRSEFCSKVNNCDNFKDLIAISGVYFQ